MTRSYKNYKIETVVRVEAGLWQAWANITPSLKSSGELSKGGYTTRQEAESAVWELVKERIDKATAEDKRP